MCCFALLVKGFKRLACCLVSDFGIMADNSGNLMITEEINMQGEPSGKSSEQAHAFYSSSGRGHGRFSPRGRGMGCGGDNQQNRLNN